MNYIQHEPKVGDIWCYNNPALKVHFEVKIVSLVVNDSTTYAEVVKIYNPPNWSCKLGKVYSVSIRTELQYDEHSAWSFLTSKRDVYSELEKLLCHDEINKSNVL